MLQELFRLHLFGREIPIFGYGLMLVIGFFTAIELAKFLARRSGMNPDLFVNAGLIALVAGIAGARLSHVLEHLGEFTRADRSLGQNLWAAINLSSGGLTYYGGFLLAFPATVAYGMWKKAPIRLGMDIIAPCLMVGLGFGRIGCFLNGCCYGAECALPWAVTYPYGSIPYDEQYADGRLKSAPPMGLWADGNGRLVSRSSAGADPRRAALAAGQRSNAVHPVQLYSTLTAWLIAAFLVAWFTLPHVPGRIFAGMMMLEGSTRFLLEMLRVEPTVVGKMSYSMGVGLLLMIGGAGLWWGLGRFTARQDRTVK